MKRLLRRSILTALLSVVALVGLRAQDAPPLGDTVAFTTTSLRLRAQPFTTAPVLAILAPATRVRTYTCSEDWCSVFVPVARRSGYVASRYLTREPPPREQTGRGYINVDGEWVASPQNVPDSQAPPDATAQCRDGTFSFSQHRSGTCSHHGGVARWLGP